MLSREEKKQLTRKSLMDAALYLVGEGDNFSNISLREVAKNAGVVPTSFYRHFKDMEELGLNLVDDFGVMLRRLMRTVRQKETFAANMGACSTDAFLHFVIEHPNYLSFICQSRTGGTPALRAAIRNELSFFANELSIDLRRLTILSEVDAKALDMTCRLFVTTYFDSAIDLLDLASTSTKFEQEYKAMMMLRLKVIWHGLLTVSRQTELEQA
jgi:AcrR family transcriptional regulator